VKNILNKFQGSVIIFLTFISTGCNISLVSWLFENEARISQTEAEEIATEPETSARRERVRHSLANNIKRNEVNQKAKGRVR
jgi:hypothetical protein